MRFNGEGPNGLIDRKAPGISVQLVDATTGHQLWADRYDREYADVFALQDEITQNIAWTLAGYSTKSAETAAATKLFEGIGTVVTVDAGKSRVVLDHEEIKDFMEGLSRCPR